MQCCFAFNPGSAGSGIPVPSGPMSKDALPKEIIPINISGSKNSGVQSNSFIRNFSSNSIGTDRMFLGSYFNPFLSRRSFLFRQSYLKQTKLFL
jgi:hypothetical protein